jgi:hypothetical protein
MSLETALLDLDRRLAALERAVDDVRWAVVEGRASAAWSHAVVDHYDATINDLAGRLREARAAAGAATDALARPSDHAGVRHALAACQEHCTQAWLSLYGDLCAYERLSALYGLKRRGRAMAVWVAGVDDALRHCPRPLYAVSEALLACWQELVEHAGAAAARRSRQRPPALAGAPAGQTT